MNTEWGTKKIKKFVYFGKSNPYPLYKIYEGTYFCVISYMGDTKRITHVRWPEHKYYPGNIRGNFRTGLMPYLSNFRPILTLQMVILACFAQRFCDFSKTTWIFFN